jgi:hypothetical protein
MMQVTYDVDHRLDHLWIRPQQSISTVARRVPATASMTDSGNTTNPVRV